MQPKVEVEVLDSAGSMQDYFMLRLFHLVLHAYKITIIAQIVLLNQTSMCWTQLRADQSCLLIAQQSPGLYVDSRTGYWSHASSSL